MRGYDELHSGGAYVSKIDLEKTVRTETDSYSEVTSSQTSRTLLFGTETLVNESAAHTVK